MENQRKAMQARQLAGIIFGLLAAALTANFFPALREQLGGWSICLVWGAALGGLFGSFVDLHVLGQRLTKGNNQPVNNFIGLLMILTLLSFVYLFYRILMSLL